MAKIILFSWFSQGLTPLANKVLLENQYRRKVEAKMS